MSGIGPEEDVAALFVLGALNAEEMRAVRIAAGRDPDLAAQIAQWERRLAPLARLVPEAAPPPTLWPQLEARLTRIGANASPAAQVYQPPPQRPRLRSRQSANQIVLWQATAASAMAIAAMLAVIIFTRAPTPAPNLAMVMPARPGSGGWLVEVTRQGDVKARATGALSRGLDQDYQLWVLEEGSDHPVPVGLLPVNAAATLKLKSVPHHAYQLLVSLEPKGGSPTGSPTGPVLYGGDVVAP